MIGIVDYGMGNLLSVYNAVEFLGYSPVLCETPNQLADCSKIILPGVGAIEHCIENLIQKGFEDALQVQVREKGKAILGICLGMQVMARRSFEGGEFSCLGWFDADVVRLRPSGKGLRVPQVGWNQVEFSTECPLFAGVPPGAEFYFVHSYHMDCTNRSEIVAQCEYGGPVTAAVARENIFATQFHPEKSQTHGLKVLGNFLALNI